MDKEEDAIAASSNEQLMGSKNPLAENSLEKAEKRLLPHGLLHPAYDQSTALRNGQGALL